MNPWGLYNIKRIVEERPEALKGGTVTTHSSRKRKYRQLQTYDHLILRWCETDMHSVETVCGISSLDLLPGWRYVVPRSPVMLGGGCSHSSHHPCDHEGKQLIPLQPFCPHTNTLFFTFSAEFNCMRYSTLDYKTGCVSDDFTQL